MTEVKKEEIIPEVKKKEFISMKKGDYTVHLYIEEVKNLVSKEEEPPLPLIKMTVLNDTKRTNELEEKVSTYFFGEHFYFDCLNMNNATLDSAKVKIEVLDKNFSSIADYIGIYEFDFSFVYNYSENHVLNNYWVALVNPCSDDYSKIRGYLRFSCSILHSSDKRVELSSNATNSDNINFPPQIKIEYYEVSLVIFKAEHLSDMDTTVVDFISNVNKSDKKIDAFVEANYMGTKVKTSVVKAKSNKVVWNEQLFLPVSFPIISEKIMCSVWDEDAGANDIVGSFEINVNDILNGYYNKVRTVHIYGAPVDRHLLTIMNSTEKKMTNYMNENCEIGSLWKGKISLMATYKKIDFPKTATIEIPSNSSLLNMPNQIKSTIWTFDVTVEKAIFLPFESENYLIACCLEEEKIIWGPEKSKLNMLDIKSRNTQKLTLTTNTDEIRDLPDLFFYLVKGSKDEEKNRICFQRIEANFFIKHNDYLIIKFYPDPVIGEINDISKSGLLKIKVQILKNGQKCLLDNLVNAVDNLKVDLTNKVEMKVDKILNKNDKDSDSEGLDEKYMNKIQKPELTKVNKIGKPSNKVTVGINIHQTAKLIAGDDSGLSDPFIVVKMLDQEKKSSIKYNSLNGIWNETLIFSGLDFDINDEKTYPEVFLQVLDYDSLSSNDVLGFTYLWINDLPNLKNNLNPITPSWVDLHLNLSNKKQGKILLSFYLIEESKTDLINKLNTLNISPESTNFTFEINVLGLRGLQSKGIIPVKKPYIIFDINSISSTSSNVSDKSSSQKESIKTEPKESGCDPNINTIVSFENFLPKEKVFTPIMECYVYDYILGGLGNSLLGVFELDISSIVNQTRNEFEKVKSLCEKKLANKYLGNALVRNSLRILDEKEKLELKKLGDVLEEKKEIKPEDINMIINDESNSNTNNPSDLKQNVKKENEDIKLNNIEEEKVDEKKSQRVRSYTTKKTFQGIEKIDSIEGDAKIIILPSFKSYSLPNQKNEKKVDDNDKKTEKKQDDNDKINEKKVDEKESKVQVKNDIKDNNDKNDKNKNVEKQDESSKNTNNQNNKDEQKKVENIIEKKDYTTVYIIEDHSKAPNPNEYMKLGYVKVSTLLDNQKLEDVVKIKQDEYQMHYRRKYNLPLEDPRNGLGISCPFVKIPIFSGAFDDVNDPLYIFKAMSKNRYKVFKDLGNNDKQDLNISSTSIGQDSETKTMGYFKGLTRIIEKNQMNEYQKFVKNMEGKVPINYLSHYDEISKNILVSKEVVVRVYILELNELAEKDYLSKSDPFIKIFLGDQEINEQKNHILDVTDCVIRKSYE